MLSDIFLITMFIVVMGLPFGYQGYWRPKVLNKSQDYFVVEEIERNTLTGKKWFFLYVGLFFMVLWGDEVIALGQRSVLAAVMMALIGAVILWLWLLFMRFCCREYTSLPMRRILDAEEMVRSIESEKFERIADKLWHSENWIRISNLFFPKSAVTGIRSRRSNAAHHANSMIIVTVDTIWEKSYSSRDFSRFDKDLKENLKKLISTLGLDSALVSEKGWTEKSVQCFHGLSMFYSYMQTHTTADFVHSRDVMNTVALVFRAPSQIVSYILHEPCTINSVGMSGATILTYDKWVLKIEPRSEECESTVRMMKWLKGKLPVPKVIHHEVKDGRSYLFMSRMQGEMSCDEYYLERPYELVELLAEGLKQLWKVNVKGCPVERTLDVWLAEAAVQVEQNRVDVDNVEPETFGENGFENPAALLEWLEENRPAYEPVFSHGDYCLPNVFLKDGKVEGFIDLGASGISDKWRDIALCYRSLKHNFDGTYGGKVYEDFNPDILFEKLGIEPDWEKIKWHILLDELF